jgi:hypothetical protein
VKYTITRGKCREWPTREYTLEDVLKRAARDGRIVRDGYGRSRIRAARKLMALDAKGKRSPVILTLMPEPEEVKPRAKEEKPNTTAASGPLKRPA